MDDRRDALRAYLHKVVHDLATRGIIRYRHGQSLDTILVAESATILAEMTSDLKAIGLEMLGTGAQIAGNFVGGILSQMGKPRR